MITIDLLVSQTVGLNRADLDRWIRNDWVRPETIGDALGFDEIDIARVILIQELRDDLEVNDAALPIVLSLIDQLYDLRRHVQMLGEVMQEAVPTDLRTRLLRELAARKTKLAGYATHVWRRTPPEYFPSLLRFPADL